jgi:hypothetical protein
MLNLNKLEKGKMIMNLGREKLSCVNVYHAETSA